MMTAAELNTDQILWFVKHHCSDLMGRIIDGHYGEEYRDVALGYWADLIVESIESGSPLTIPSHMPHSGKAQTVELSEETFYYRILT